MRQREEKQERGREKIIEEREKRNKRERKRERGWEKYERSTEVEKKKEKTYLFLGEGSFYGVAVNVLACYIVSKRAQTRFEELCI